MFLFYLWKYFLCIWSRRTQLYWMPTTIKWRSTLIHMFNDRYMPTQFCYWSTPTPFQHQKSCSLTCLTKTFWKENYFSHIGNRSYFIEIWQHWTVTVTWWLSSGLNRNLHADSLSRDGKYLRGTKTLGFVSHSFKTPKMAGPDLVKTVLYTINNLLQQEKYKAALAVVKGFRNGAV